MYSRRLEMMKQDSKLALNTKVELMKQARFQVPEFKFVFCSSIMLKQILNAFINKEVSFQSEESVQISQHIDS